MLDLSAVIAVGLAARVEAAAFAGPETKLIVAVCVIVIDPILAVTVLASAFVDRRFAVVWPLLSVAGGVDKVAPVGRSRDRFTRMPGSGLPEASFTKTVIVEVSVPFAVTVVG